MATQTQDPFDILLTQTMDVMERDTAAGDDRGLSDPTFTTVGSAVPCRISTAKKLVGSGKEVLARMKEAIAYREVFMRPWYADPDPDGSVQPFVVTNGTTYNTQPLTHDHWLLTPSQSILNANGEPTPGMQLDIFEIDPLCNQDGSLHHLEVWCRVVLV